MEERIVLVRFEDDMDGYAMLIQTNMTEEQISYAENLEERGDLGSPERMRVHAEEIGCSFKELNFEKITI